MSSDCTSGRSHSDRSLVSIVIPCFNQAEFIGEAINCALGQTYKPVEIIVVDDGSTDNSAEIASGFPGVTVLRQENTGVSMARNAGVAASRGDYIVFLDGDDRMRPDCVECRVGLLEKNPDAGMVVGSLRIVDRGGTVIRVDDLPCKHRIGQRKALRLMTCPTCGMAMSRKAFDECGGFDPDLRIGEDSDLLVRLTRRYKCLVDAEARADYRQVGGSLSRDYVLLFDSFRYVYKKNRSGAWNRWSYTLNSTAGMISIVCDRVFGKMLKDKTGGSFGPQAWKVVRARPVLALYLAVWFMRALRNRFLKLFGRGPLAATSRLDQPYEGSAHP